MKSIGAFSAKTHLSDLLEQVAHGESFLITKRGKPMASLSPVTPTKIQGPRDIILEFRKKYLKPGKKISDAEIVELKNLGRK
jgi:prevent-host-death family protein